MKMLMVICPETRAEDIRTLISGHDVHAYTELQDVTGSGAKGLKLGTRTWPGRSILVFTVVPEGKTKQLLQALEECKQTLLPEESMHAFVMPVEHAL